MDHRPDSSRLTVASPEPASSRPNSAAVICDQAIFTCIRSAMGQGYRIVASSPGLQRSETAEIVAHAPSGDGLCDASPKAVGVAFVPLSSGRFAVLHSVYAGKEPTGRGGQRTYTRAFVVAAEGLQRLHNNPFDLLRAAEAAGATGVDLTPGKNLPQLALANGPPTATLCLGTAMDQVGDGWLGHFVELLLNNETLIVSAGGDPLALTEAAVLATPAPFRPSISFSAGIRFSVARISRFNVIGHDGTRAQQAVRGRKLAFADVTTAHTPPRPPGHPWVLAVQRFLTTHRTDRLIALSSERFGDADAGEVERIGNACLDLDNIETADTAEVIDTASAYIEHPVASPLGEDLSREIVCRARSRLDSLIARSDVPVLVAMWQDLPPEWPQKHDSARFATEIVRLMIDRMSRIAPLNAMALTIQAAERGCFAHSTTELDRVANGVMSSVRTWAVSATPGELAAAEEPLTAWGQWFPNDPSVSVILSRIHNRPGG